MDVKVLIKDVMFDNSSKEELEQMLKISENTTIQELFDIAGCSCGDISDYYEYSGVFSHNCIFCPFIITEKGVQFNILFSEAKVVDFFRTHNITNNTIRVTTGYPQAGGPGLKEILEIWKNISPFLETITPCLNFVAIISTITGINLKTIWDHFKSKKVPPHTVVDMLSTKKQWNHNELAEILGIPKKNAKHLLKAFGYKYNKSKKLYTPSKLTDELKEKIKNIQVYDID